jgi:predicted O-methyltransferase YrrM
MRQAPDALGRKQIQVLQIAEGFVDSQVLFTANELGLFEKLAGGPRSADELAADLAAPVDSLTRLLNAAVAIGMLELKDGRYANGAVAAAVLVAGRPGYLGSWLRLMSRFAKAWTGLKESVRSGRPAEDPNLKLGGDPEYTRDFILAMDDYARIRGSEICRYLDLGGGRRMLDVGGGPGTYAILFAKHWPDLRVTVFDLPEVVKIASEKAEAAGVADRVQTAPGSYHDELPGTDYDFVFISDTLFQEQPEGAEKLLRKCLGALKSGGRIVVQGMFLNEDRVSPRWPVVQALMLLVNATGRPYTAGETVRLLQSAGFRDCVHRRMSLLNVHSFVEGVR